MTETGTLTSVEPEVGAEAAIVGDNRHAVDGGRDEDLAQNSAVRSLTPPCGFRNTPTRSGGPGQLGGGSSVG